MLRFAVPLVFLFAAFPALSLTLESGGTGSVSSIVDGDTLVLDDGREIRLVGVQAPKLPLGRPNFKKWPLADESKALLETLATGKTLALSYGGRRIDRYHRLLAHLHDTHGLWLQGELLRRGMARVYSFADNRANVAEMLVFEREARTARRGIWRHPFYYTRNAAELSSDTTGFQIVEGTVHAVATVRKRTYVNFGADWRTDFTISIGAKAQRLFEEAQFHPKGLEGKRIRVRGWVKSYNGPMIEATHPEQIEILE